MADVKWIKICTDIFDDEKILMIESLPSADTIIVIWFKLLTLAGKQNNNGVFLMNNRIAYTDEMLATIFRRDLNVVRMALKTFEDFGMIEIISSVITIPNWNKHQSLDAYEKKKERDRIYQQGRREKQRLLAEKSSDKSLDSKATQSSDVAVSDKDKEREEERDINTNSASDNAQSKVSKKEINSFFEEVWKLYPNKKGKAQISDAKKKVLYEIGIDELSRAIERYKTDLAKEEWRKPQNGSTFFNGGYVDYLDENYEPLKVQQKKSTNKFNNFQQRQYSKEQMDDFERMLLTKNV